MNAETRKAIDDMLLMLGCADFGEWGEPSIETQEDKVVFVYPRGPRVVWSRATYEDAQRELIRKLEPSS